MELRNPSTLQSQNTVTYLRAGPYTETADVYSVERDVSMSFYKSRPSSPVWLEVMGPCQLKLELRPLHDEHDAPIDDRVHIKGDVQHSVTAITNNRRSSGLRIAGDAAHVPGWEVERVIEVGPGLHRINVAAESVDVLVRVLASRPDLPISILPPLTRETLNAVLGGTYTRREAVQFAEMHRRFVHFLPMSDTGLPSQLPLTRPVTTRPVMVNSQSTQLKPKTAARLAMRTGQPLSDFASVLDDISRESPIGLSERRLAAAQSGQQSSMRTHSVIVLDHYSDFRRRKSVEPSRTNTLGVRSTELERNEFRSSSETDDDVLDRMESLLHRAETDPVAGWKHVVEGLHLCAKHPRIRRMQSLRQRLTRKTEWSRFQQFSNSAGVRTVSVTGWSPESPSIRVRRSMLPPVPPAEHIITADRRLVLSLNILDPRLIQLDLRSEHIEFVSAAPITVAFQVDGLPERQIELSPENPDGSVRIAFDGGTHRLQCWIVNPLANQFLRLKIVEQPRSSGHAEHSVVREQKRVYEVATNGEPIRFEVLGPAWIRIDELRDGTTLTKYQAVLDESQEIELRPRSGQRQALFRVFELVPAVNAVRHAAYSEERTPVPVPDPLIPGPTDRSLPGANLPDESAGVVRIHDAFPLGGQESATWSTGLSAVRRRPLEEGIDGRQPDEFLQFGITRSYFDEWRRNYWRTGLLYRQRTDAGPSVGIEQAFRHDGDLIPLTAILQGAAYVQNPGGAIAPANNQTEWSAVLRGKLQQYQQITPTFSHLPAISIFGRLMSLGRNVYAAGRLDQDIFTPYKTNHRHGTTLSESFSFRPWIDSRLWLRGSLTSNEDFNITSPDHISFRTGWIQALGPVTVAASYRLTRFFQDDDRALARLQNLVYFDTFADGWPTLYNRSELGFRLQHDLDRGSTSAWLAVNWFFDNGRDYRDLMPGEIEFENLRMQRASQRWNNEIFPLHR